MDYRELRKLVRQGEGLSLEFKLKANHPEKIVREVVAFANTEGGMLLIGVDDDRGIKGLKFAEEDEYVLIKAFHDHCYPRIRYTLDKITVEDDREVLAFTIPKSSQLHYVIDEPDSRKGRAYIRLGDKSVKASSEMRQILRGKKKKRDIKFTFGDKERILMQYLENHHRITVAQFSQTAKIPRRVASRTLVLLVLAKVLEIKPNVQEDSFEFIEPEFSWDNINQNQNFGGS